MSFQIRALDKAQFEPLFALGDAELAEHRAVRAVADRSPGFPCRVSLQDAAVGEELILVNFEHQPAASPYRASHAVWVRAAAETARPEAGEVPRQLRTRMLSLRAFDGAGMIVGAELTEGWALETACESLLADPKVNYLHAHFAKPGCFAARIDRV